MSLKERLAAKANELLSASPAQAETSTLAIFESTTVPAVAETIPEAVVIDEKLADRKEIPIEVEVVAKASETEAAKEVRQEAEQTYEDIIPKIRALSEIEDGTLLDDEMEYLKVALLANPSAVALMLPEDVGMLVVALRRVTGEEILAAVKGKGKKKESKMMSVDELLAMAEKPPEDF